MISVAVLPERISCGSDWTITGSEPEGFGGGKEKN